MSGNVPEAGNVFPAETEANVPPKDEKMSFSGTEPSAPREAEKPRLPRTGDTAPREVADGLFLADIDGKLTLTDGKLQIFADLSADARRLRPNNLGGELLVRAARFKNRPGPFTAVDATAGFGEDSLLLAAAGFDVTMFEYNPVIAALLADGLRRAAEDPALAEIVARMHLICGDSTKGMRELGFSPDAVLLDPMFPERQKSGSIKKKFQLLQRLESPCSTEEELLSAALAANPRKIVIKRPAKGPYLAGRKPSYSVAGNSVRYDCIVIV